MMADVGTCEERMTELKKKKKKSYVDESGQREIM